MKLERHLGLTTSIFIVIASMVGSFIFAVPGQILANTNDATIHFSLWFAGGLIAFCGALCFAELATMMPEVGGEYVYLKKIYGLLPAFLSGWISLLIAFSASIATSAIFFHIYLGHFIVSIMGQASFEASIFANEYVMSTVSTSIVILLGITHVIGLRFGSQIQNILTVIKLSFVVFFIVFGFIYADWSQVERLTASNLQNNVSPITAIGYGSTLLLVMSAFSGWNAATYIAGEIKNPAYTLPRALFWGTTIVTVIYIGLNVVFIIASPAEQVLGGNPWKIGAVASDNLFGNIAGKLFNMGIMLLLLSSISVQMLIGPRVYYAMSRDRVIFKSLSTISEKYKTPYVAIIVQIILTVIYIFLGRSRIDVFFEYISFSLGLTPFLTVIGLMYLRKKFPNLKRPYKVHFYPLIPLIFLAANVYMMVSALKEKPMSSLFSLALFSLGVFIFYVWQIYSPKTQGEKDKQKRNIAGSE